MTSTKLGVVSIKNGDTELLVEAGFSAAVKIHAAKNMDILVWMENLLLDATGNPNRMGITEIFYTLQKTDEAHPELTMEQIWDTFTGNPEALSDPEHMNKVMRTIFEITGKQWQDVIAEVAPDKTGPDEEVTQKNTTSV